MATSPWRQTVGLIGRKGLSPDEGLWLEPCNGIHTLFMRFAIDAVFLDRDGRVLRIVENLGPGRMCGPVRKARVVIEIAAGTAAGKFRLGESCRVESLSDETV